jgi:hypothetical protein
MWAIIRKAINDTTAIHVITNSILVLQIEISLALQADLADISQ